MTANGTARPGQSWAGMTPRDFDTTAADTQDALFPAPDLAGTADLFDSAEPEPEVVTEHTNAAGEVYAVTLRLADGATATVRADGVLDGADPKVWANPAKYGFELRCCPGHGGVACQYGAHDTVRYTAPLPGGTP